jgi:hypothetical protein
MFNLKVNKEFLNFNSFFEGRQFEMELNQFYSDFKNYNIDYKDYGKKSIDDKINTDDFNNLKKQYDSELENKLQDTENQYNSQIENAESNGNKDKVTRLTEEKNKKLEEIKKQNTKSADDIKKELANILENGTCIIDGSLGTAKQLERQLIKNNILNTSNSKGSIKIISSLENEDIINLSYRLLNLNKI